MQVLVVLERQAYWIVVYQYKNSIKTVGLIDFFHRKSTDLCIILISVSLLFILLSARSASVLNGNV